MICDKKYAVFICSTLVLMFALGTAAAKEKTFAQEIKEETKHLVEEVKDAGKTIGEESKNIGKEIGAAGKEIGHSAKDESKKLWQNTKDGLQSYLQKKGQPPTVLSLS